MLELNLPRRFNAAEYFIDRNVDEGKGAKTAVVSEDRAYTYSELLERVNSAANMFKGLGLEIENRVMLLVRDTPEMIFAFYGALKLGAVPIPTNILLKAPDFLHMLNDSRARILIVDDAFLPEIEKVLDQAMFLERVVVVGGQGQGHENFEALMDISSTGFRAAETTPDDTAFWLYSGRNPEVLMGAVHHHSHMVYCSEAYAKGILGIDEKDRIMGSFLFFAYGLGNCVYFPFAVGATVILPGHRPSPELVYKDLVAFRPTLFFTVPTLLGALADYRKECRDEGKELQPVDSLRACISSAEVLSSQIYKRFKDEFNVEVVDGTGSTELCHIFLSNRLDDVKIGSTGRLVPGYEARLLDDDGRPVVTGETGNLQIKGGSTASAYWNRRQETRKNMLGEWFVTGDRYMVDAEGFYHFRGRSDDMLRIGGRWLAPQEVEKTINTHPSVTDSAVVGLKDEDELVKPYAFVVLEPTASPTDSLREELKAYVKERISSYKYPRWVEFIDVIPRTAGGNIKRYVLQERLQGVD